jgi:hypothetical protein
MAPIQSIFIPYIREYWSSELIATFLYDSGIASTSRMEVFTSNEYGFEFKCALIEIDQWLDTENAYEFICSLNYNGSTVLDISDEFWIVYKEAKMEHMIDLLVGDPSVTCFTSRDFEQWESLAMEEYELLEDNNNMDEIDKHIDNDNDDMETLLDEDEEYYEDDDEDVVPLCRTHNVIPLNQGGDENQDKAEAEDQEDNEEYFDALYDFELTKFIEMNMYKYCDAISTF